MQPHLSGTTHIISITQRERWWWWWSWWPSWSGWWWWWGRLEVVASSRGNYWQFLVHLACTRHSPRARIATDLNRSQDSPQEILKWDKFCNKWGHLVGNQSKPWLLLFGTTGTSWSEPRKFAHIQVCVELIWGQMQKSKAKANSRKLIICMPMVLENRQVTLLALVWVHFFQALLYVIFITTLAWAL